MANLTAAILAGWRERLGDLEASSAGDVTQHVAAFLGGGDLPDGVMGLRVLLLAEAMARNGWDGSEPVRQAMSAALRASYTGSADRVTEAGARVLERIEQLRAAVEERASVLGADLRFL